MVQRSLLFLGVMVCGLGGARAAEPEKALVAKVDPGQMAHRLWTIVNVVQENQIDPPGRTALLQGTVKGLLGAAKVTIPADLAERVGRLESEAQLTGLFKELLTKGTAAELETALFQSLSHAAK